MNVLLINPNREQMPWPVVPIGLSSVATATAAAGHRVELLDLTFSKHPAQDTRRRVQELAPEVVGITVRNIDNCNFESPHFYLTEIRDEVVASVRSAAPSAKIVIGGSAVNVSPQDIFRYLAADYALAGEGEVSLPEFLRVLSEGGDLRTVTGLIAPGPRSDKLLPILDTGRLSRNEPANGRAILADLEQGVRSEAWRWVDVARYTARGGSYPIQTKRGCALKCSYCVYNNIEGSSYRLRDPEHVVDEIAEAFEHGVRKFDFVDSTFNLPLSHARALCAELASRPLPVELSTMGLNPAGVTPELIADMRRAGFKNVMCTPESASDVTLKSLQKGFKKRAVIEAAKALAGARMPTYWFFILGAPGETMDTVRETLEFCETYIPPTDMVLFSTGIRVYAGTPLEQYCKETGWFAADDPLFMPSWYLSPELQLSELYSALVRAAEAHPNWMTNAETVLNPTMSVLLKSALRAVGMKGAFWQHLPKLFQLTGRVGLRQRGLSQHAAKVRRIKDVPHHR